MNLLALFSTVFSFLLWSLTIRKIRLVFFFSCHIKKPWQKNITKPHLWALWQSQKCLQIASDFPEAPSWAHEIFLVEFLVLLSSATNLTYFFLEKGHSSYFEHFFTPFSLLSERLQLIPATENFCQHISSCMYILANKHTNVCGYLHFIL